MNRALYTALAFLFGLGIAWAAPSDDGQTAGSRNWILYQGRKFVAVTPDDSNDLALAPTRFIITAGVVTTGVPCVLAMRGADDGTTTVNVTLAAGMLHPMQVKRVLSTNTTCTSIVAVY